MKPKTIYMLDTNMVSYIADGRSHAARRALMETARHSDVAISSLVEGELLYGLARKPQAIRLRSSVESLFASLLILPWDSVAAASYATLRLRMSSRGKSLSAIDTLVAAHAIAVDAILVTKDTAFSQIDALRPPIDWATDL